LEIVKRNPLIVLDAAHSRESAFILKLAVRKFFDYKRLILVLGLSKDKDIKGVSQDLAGVSDEVILTQALNPRAVSPEVIKEYIRNKALTLTNTVEEALDKAYSKAKEEDLILVTGSLFVVGEAKAYLDKGVLGPCRV
jgi:dihydrofolate synthase/folylpolyglutamate synthase